MSFSQDTKVSAAKLPKSKEESKAMLYGMSLFSQQFNLDQLMLRSETPEVSDMFCGLMLAVYDIAVFPQTENIGSNTFYTVLLQDSKLLKFIFSEFQPTPGHIDFTLIHNHTEELAFVKGAFLVCGYINSPDKSYRLDFTVNTPDLAAELATVIAKAVGVMPKLSVRKSKQIVYYRGSSTIVDVLNMLGLNNSAFIIMNSQIEREIKNNINRKNNFDIANIGKTAKSSALQMEAIQWITDNGKFESIPNALKQTARNRMNFPDESLESIGKRETPPISKSQVSKRLHQIVEIYQNEIKKS